jgi:CBS domain-containing protein
MSTRRVASPADRENLRRAERARFLARFEPFRGLTGEDLSALAAAATERVVLAGEPILVQGGPPGHELYVVRHGAFELVRDDVAVSLAAAGQVVGHPTLLTGLAPEFTTRARRDSLVYCIPRELAIDVLSRPSGIQWLAGNQRERLIQAARTLSGLHNVHSTLPVTSTVRSKPLFCAPETSIEDAARLMREEHRSAILVRTRDGRLGIITDVDLRDKVVAGDVPRDAPVTEIMICPAHTVGAEALAPEASVAMMAAGVNHMPVIDAAGEVVGILSASCLMSLDARSPFALRRTIMRAHDVNELYEAAADIPVLFLDLMSANLDPASVTSVLTVLQDAITTRLLELAIQRHGDPPAAYAWLAFGSAARSELTLASDQDNGLAYDDADDPAVGEYFRLVARDVNSGLIRCGWPEDPHGVLARHEEWSLPLAGWRRVFEDCLAGKDLDRLARASVAFDYRQVTGELRVDKVLSGIMRDAPRHRRFLQGLVDLGTKTRPPLSFRGKLEGSIDIKKHGLVPIQNLARYYAFATGITASTTLERLAAIGDVVSDFASEDVLREAFLSITNLQLRHHAEQLRHERPVTNVVDTWLLPPLTFATLQEAMREVLSAQKHSKPVEAPG